MSFSLLHPRRRLVALTEKEIKENAKPLSSAIVCISSKSIPLDRVLIRNERDDGSNSATGLARTDTSET